MTTSSQKLIPELSVTDIKKSLQFYTDILGFFVAYERPEEGFAFLIMGEVELMLDEIGKGRTWETGDLTPPLGRGVNFQIEVENVDDMLERIKKNEVKLFLELEEKWYRVEDHESGNKQFLVQDPDGYLLRFTQDLGDRSLQN